MPSVADLPAELLSYIFEAYVAPPSANLPTTLRVVCKRWREISESTPGIWNDLLLGSGTQWTQRALEWSGSCPLTVDAVKVQVQERPDWHDSMLLILPNIHRIKGLYVGFPPHHFPGKIRQIMRMLDDCAAPLLEAFRMTGPTNPLAILKLGLNFLSAPLPRLREVRISNCIIVPQCPILGAPQLSSLTIRQCTIWSTMDEVVETLRLLPLLETFRWEDQPPDGATFEGSTLLPPNTLETGPTKLSNLRSLDIRHTIEAIVNLMDRIEMPSSCTIALDASLVNNPATAMVVDAVDRVLSPYLSARFPIGSGKGYGGFVVSDFWHHMARGLTVQWTMDSEAAVDDYSGQKGDLSLALHEGHFDDDEMLSMIWRMVDRWPATRVAVRHIVARHPHVFGNRPSDLSRFIPSWVAILGKFEAVEKLSISSRAIAYLPALLSSSHTRIFPRLELIIVRFAKMTSTDVGLLSTALLQRRDGVHSSSSSKVILENCEVDNVDRPKREMVVALGEMPRPKDKTSIAYLIF
ncbi:unnamed protein product [Peniophora sp. CBMAI 1063]|nr:unnamed protein product [Peniophora sp. CBMAI 1063]